MGYWNPINPNTGLSSNTDYTLKIYVTKDNAPKSDSHMKWDNELKMYHITPVGFKAMTGVSVADFLPETFKNEQYETFLLKDVAQRVYEIIMEEHSWTNNINHYLRLAFDPSLRNHIKRVLQHASENTVKTQKLLLGDQHMLTGYTANRTYDDQSLHLQRMLKNNGIIINANNRLQVLIAEDETLPEDWENGWLVGPKAGE